MKNKYQALAGNTVKLGLGTFRSKVLVFLMVRFYTEYLSPADYGTADLMTQTASLLILRAGVMGAVLATLLSYVLVFLVRAVSIRRLLPFSPAVPTVLLDAALLTIQSAFLTLQLPGWIAIQTVCLTLLLILNGKPLLLAVKKLFGARRKGVTL